jgi:hypothetical protein
VLKLLAMFGIRAGGFHLQLTAQRWELLDADLMKAYQAAHSRGSRPSSSMVGTSGRRSDRSREVKGSATGDYQVAPSRRRRSTSAVTSTPWAHGHPQ